MTRQAATNRAGMDASLNNLTAGATSTNISCHQGVMTDGTYFYGVHTNAIYKFNANWSLVASNTHANTDAGISHLGDGQCHSGRLYIAAEDYTSESINGNYRIAIFSTSDLSFIEYKTLSQPVEASSLCIDSTAGIIYVSNYTISDKIYKYSLADFSYLGSIQLSQALHHTQGISIYGGYLWISRGTPYFRLYKISMSGEILESRQVATSGELEGIDFTTGIFYLLIDDGVTQRVAVYNMSSRIICQNITSSLNFNGTTYVSTSYTLPTNGTIFCRVKLKRLFNFNSLWDCSGDPNKWECWVYGNGTIAVETGINNPRIGPISLNNPIGRWITVGFTWKDQGVATLYIDGTAVGTAAATTASSGTTFYWGGGNAGNTKGELYMCDARIYTSALTDKQMQLLCNTGADPIPPAVKQLFNEGVGTAANDTSGNNCNGTITSGAWSTQSPSIARNLASKRLLA